MSPLRRRVHTGISYDDIRMEFGWISEFEEREVAIKSGYRWEDWLEMDTRERASHVAFHRVHMLISAHSEDAAQDHFRRESKRRGA